MSAREIIRGMALVDAPRTQRVAGVAMALVAIVALPASIVLRDAPFDAGLFGGNALGFAVCAFLFFAGLGIAAAAGTSLEGRGRRRDAILIEDGGCLTLASDGEVWTFPLRALESGHYVVSQRQVIFFAEGERVAMRVDDRKEGQRVLAALGVDAGPTTLELSPQEPGPRAVEGCLSGVAGLLTAMLAMGVAAIASSVVFQSQLYHAVVPVLVSGVVPLLITIRWVGGFGAALEVVLGSDGIMFGTRRDGYIPYADIAAIEACDDAVVIRRKGGGDLFIRTAEPDTLATALAAKLEEDPPASERLGALERGGQSLDEWRAQLEQLAETTPRYRVGYVGAERLACIAEDPHAPLDERVGAAFVIAARGDKALLTRVQAAAGASAHPTVRAALARAAEGELEEQALEDAATLLAPCDRPAA